MVHFNGPTRSDLGKTVRLYKVAYNYLIVPSNQIQGTCAATMWSGSHGE